MKEFEDKQFDIVFSNSVIEHVGSFEDQLKMADEIRRVGEKYFVQTPNYFFPIEPHFLFPFFQFLPVKLRIFLVSHFSIGWYERIQDPERALRAVTENRLLKPAEMKQLFPECKIWREKIFGITKSLIAISR